MSGSYISKIPVLVVALVIGIVLVTSAVVPLASDYSEAKTFKNEGFYKMDMTGDGNLTFRWDYDTPTKFTINGEEVEYTNSSTMDQSVVAAPGFFVRLRPGNEYCYYNGTGGNIVADGTGEYISITISEGSGSITDGTTTKTFTEAGNIYFLFTTGDWVMKQPTDTAYLNGDSTIFSRGGSTVSGHWAPFTINATIDDGATVTTIDTMTIDTDSISVNADEVGGYINLYKFTSITFDATYTGETTPAQLTYNYVIVPAEVTADPDNPAAYKNLVKIVPLMAFIMLVVAAAGMVYFKNKD